MKSTPSTLLRYFDCGHLPQHLQDIVAPYRKCANLVAETVSRSDLRALGAIDALAAEQNKRECADPVESRAAVNKLLEAFATVPVDECLRLLLEAKDCAVRAMIPEMK